MMNCCLTEQAREIIDKYRTDQVVSNRTKCRCGSNYYVALNEGCLCVLVGRFNGILPSKLFQNIH